MKLRSASRAGGQDEAPALPTLPWELILMAMDHISCRHCLAKLSRTSRVFHEKYLSKIWETVEIAEWHSSFLDQRSTETPKQTHFPKIVDRFTKVDHNVPWPHLFGLLWTLYQRPDLARLVKHFKITRQTFRRAPRYNYERYCSTAPESIPGAPDGFADFAYSRITAHASRQGDVKLWKDELVGSTFGDAYLGILLSLLAESLESVDISRTEPCYYHDDEDPFGTFFFRSDALIASGHPPDSARSCSTWPSLRKLTMRGEILPVKVSNLQDEQFSGSHAITEMVIERTILNGLIHDGEPISPTLEVLELDRCKIDDRFYFLAAALEGFPALKTLRLSLASDWDVSHADIDEPTNISHGVNMDELLSALVGCVYTLENFVFMDCIADRPQETRGAIHIVPGRATFERFVKLKRLHISDNLFQAIGWDTAANHSVLFATVLPETLVELCVIDPWVDEDFVERAAPLVEARQTRFHDFSRLILRSDKVQLRMHAASVHNLVSIYAAGGVECLVIESAHAQHFIKTDSEDLQPWSEMPDIRADWRAVVEI